MEMVIAAAEEQGPALARLVDNPVGGCRCCRGADRTVRSTLEVRSMRASLG